MHRPVVAIAVFSLGLFGLIACEPDEEPQALDEDFLSEPAVPGCLVGGFERVAGGFIYQCGPEVYRVLDSGDFTLLGSDVDHLAFDADRNPILVGGDWVERFDDSFGSVETSIPVPDEYAMLGLSTTHYATHEEWSIASFEIGLVVWWNDEESHSVQVPTDNTVLGLVASEDGAYVVHENYVGDWVEYIDFESGEMETLEPPLDIAAVEDRDGEPLFAGWSDSREIVVGDLEVISGGAALTGITGFAVIEDLCERDGIAVVVSNQDREGTTLLVSDQGLEISGVHVIDFGLPIERCSVYEGEVYLLDTLGGITLLGEI